MAFRLPTFNITVAIHRNFGPPYNIGHAPASTPMGQLRELKTALIVSAEGGFRAALLLALPAGTDIRGGFDYITPAPGPQDIVEVPQGSQVWYAVTFVADVAKGFANEYRSAVIERVPTRIDGDQRWHTSQ